MFCFVFLYLKTHSNQVIKKRSTHCNKHIVGKAIHSDWSTNQRGKLSSLRVRDAYAFSCAAQNACHAIAVKTHAFYIVALRSKGDVFAVALHNLLSSPTTLFSLSPQEESGGWVSVHDEVLPLACLFVGLCGPCPQWGCWFTKQVH